MESLEIGHIELVPLVDGRIRLQIANGLWWTHWSVAGAQAAVAWLQAWIAAQEGTHGCANARLPVVE